MIADPKPERRIVDPDAEPLDSLPIDVGVCPFCAQRTTHWHPHHVVNRSQGGDNVPENLVWCCPTCHGLLHNRRGGKAFNGRFVSYCRIAVPEVGAYTDGAKFDGWLERRYA